MLDNTSNLKCQHDLTKKGNPKYHFALKDDGNLVEQIPDGYEIYENPNGQVFLRRVKQKIITDEERNIVANGVEELAQTPYTRIDVRDKAIVAYVADQDTDLLMEAFERLDQSEQTRARFEQYLSYSPKMRFVLVDMVERLFDCE